MRSSTEELYKGVAARLGLAQFQASAFSVTVGGALDGVEVSAAQFSASQTVTRALVRPPAHVGLVVTPASTLGKLAEALSGISSAGGTPLGMLFGGDTVTTADCDLDRAFTVHGHAPGAVMALLTPAVRNALWTLQRAEAFFVLTDVHVQIRRHAVLGAELIEWDLRAAATLARALGEAVKALGG